MEETVLPNTQRQEQIIFMYEALMEFMYMQKTKEKELEVNITGYQGLKYYHQENKTGVVGRLLNSRVKRTSVLSPYSPVH